MLPEQFTLPVMGPDVLTTRGTAQGPAARVTRDHVSPHQAGAAHQTHGPGVVVGARGGGNVTEHLLPGPDVSGGHKEPPAPVLVPDKVLGDVSPWG